MFIQVIDGRVDDPAAMRKRFEGWVLDIAPDVAGWLGSTGGVTADGEGVFVVRFTDEQAARANADRVEQGEWWAGTEALFDGVPTFRNYTETKLMAGGGSDDAGFVQVIQGRWTGPGSPADAIGADEARRPDVIGSSLAWDDGGHFTDTVYFTSEAEARAGEAGDAEAGEDPTGDMRRHVEGLRFLDLADPWLASP